MSNFEEMLNEIYNSIEEKKRNVHIELPKPILIKSGHNTLWKNIKQYLRIIRRPPDHFLDFLKYEMSIQVNWITESKSDGCILYNKVKEDILYDLMKKYIKDYVFCKSCKSNETYIIKIKELRKYNFVCTECQNEYII